jgi:hypothetical protein
VAVDDVAALQGACLHSSPDILPIILEGGLLMNRLLSAALLGLLLALSTSAAQASEAGGRITYLLVRDADGVIYFEVDGPRSAKPACATNHNYFMIRDENSATGKRTYALLLSAFLSGRAVDVGGAGVCTRWPDGEDVSYVRLR